MDSRPAGGDSDHVVNRRSLCVRGMPMFPTHASPQRLQVPKYRAPHLFQKAARLLGTVYAEHQARL